MISDGLNKHYCAIVNFNKLLRSAITKHKEARRICKRCYSHFGEKSKLLAHLDYCKITKAIPILPYVDKDGNPKPIEFKSHNKSKDPEIAYFADMECYLNMINEKVGKNTERCHKHTPSGHVFFIDTFDWEIIPPYLEVRTQQHRGEDIINLFLTNIENDARYVFENYLSKNKQKQIEMTPEDKWNFEKAVICHICEKPLDGDKVKDHCHISGWYRGAAHNACNLNYKIPNEVTVAMHNGGRYDWHIFIRYAELAGRKVDCIPCTDERIHFFLHRFYRLYFYE